MINYRKFLKIYLISVFIIFSNYIDFGAIFIKTAFAEPSINSVIGQMSHENIIVINGSEFGIKNPAAPYLWDDGEGKTVDSDSAIAAVYGSVSPSTNGAPVAEYRTRYRTIPYSGPDSVSPTPGPHSFSSTYMAGGHYTYPDNNPAYIGGGNNYRDVALTYDSGAANKDTWYAIWYYRLDADWTKTSKPFSNHKWSVVQTGASAYGSVSSYTTFRTNLMPAHNEATVHLSITHGGPCRPTWPTGYTAVNNPNRDWTHVEERIRSNSETGYRGVTFDNILGVESANDCPNWKNNTRSYTVGGYYRWSITGGNSTTAFRGYSGGTDANPENNSFRYFDDVYIDGTWSRVMLANNATYENATIIEPQIPSVWEADGTSITATVNQGKLPNGTAYIFVFDSDNNHNPNGVPVTLSGATPDTMPPTSPPNPR